jgi:hypothetical protein
MFGHSDKRRNADLIVYPGFQVAPRRSGWKRSGGEDLLAVFSKDSPRWSLWKKGIKEVS